MDTMEERWLPVKDYEGLYEVSDFGRIKGLKRGGILAGNVLKGGYLRVDLSKNKTRKSVLVHRIVLQTFKPTEEYLQVDHENQIRNDNRLINLRWATPSQNQRHKSKQEGCSSRFLGVYKNGNRWRAECQINGKLIYLGYFANEEEAGKAYNEFIIKHDLQDFNILNQIN